jgi:hypothetical protein
MNDAMGGEPEGIDMINVRCTSLLIKVDERTLRTVGECRVLSAQPG